MPSFKKKKKITGKSNDCPKGQGHITVTLLIIAESDLALNLFCIIYG